MPSREVVVNSLSTLPWATANLTIGLCLALYPVFLFRIVLSLCSGPRRQRHCLVRPLPNLEHRPRRDRQADQESVQTKGKQTWGKS